VFFYYSRILSCVDRSTKSFFVRTKRWPRFLPVPPGVICPPSRFSLACTSISLLRCSFPHLLSNAPVYCGEAGRSATIAPEPSLATPMTLSRLASIFLDHWRSKLGNTSIYEFLPSASDLPCRAILSWWPLEHTRSRIDWIFSSNLVKDWHGNFCIAPRPTRTGARLILVWYYSVSLMKSVPLWTSMKAFFW